MTSKKKTEKARPVVEGADARIVVNLFLPEMQPQEYVIQIKNFKGRATYAQRTWDKVVGAIIAGLTRKYGKL